MVIFDGGFGTDWAEFDLERYEARYPDSKAKVEGTQQIKQSLQPRFVAGDPPDVVDNSGTSMDLNALLAEDQLNDLTAVLDAPSWDVDGATVRDMFLPGALDFGTFDDRVLAMPYTYTMTGIWYSSSLFKKRGWEYPRTWDAMLELCAEIKKSGIAPWTYQGQAPGYLVSPLLSMAAKIGGLDALVAIDNLESGAWKSDAVGEAATALHELRAKNYIMSGTKALSHTEAQTAWLQGKAAFIPCGSWLENEMKTPPRQGLTWWWGRSPTRTRGRGSPSRRLESPPIPSSSCPARRRTSAVAWSFCGS